MDTRILIKTLGGLDILAQKLATLGVKISTHGIRKWRLRGLPNNFRLRCALVQIALAAELDSETETRVVALLRAVD